MDKFHSDWGDRIIDVRPSKSDAGELIYHQRHNQTIVLSARRARGKTFFIYISILHLIMYEGWEMPRLTVIDHQQ